MEIADSCTVQELSEAFRRLVGFACRVTLVLGLQILNMARTVASTLKDEEQVTVIIRQDAWILRQVDMDTGRRTMLLKDACWRDDTLLLRSKSSHAFPGWDVCPDLNTNFAVCATVKLDEWPELDWQGSVASQHGFMTGWELRVGGGGVNSVFTTKHRNQHSHNEHMLPLEDKVGKWHHFCMVYDAVSGCITLYADGVAGEPKKIEGRFIPYTKGGAEIGRNPHWHDRGIVGKIRNATVWSRGFNVEDLPELAVEQIAEAEASEYYTLQRCSNKQR